MPYKSRLLFSLQNFVKVTLKTLCNLGNLCYNNMVKMYF